MADHTHRTTGRTALLFFMLVCSLLAVVLILHELLLVLVYLSLLMVIFDILEILHAKWKFLFHSGKTIFLRGTNQTGTIFRRLLINDDCPLNDNETRTESRPLPKKESPHDIYIRTRDQRVSRLYQDHMNDSNLTSHELREWQENIDRIERNRMLATEEEPKPE